MKQAGRRGRQLKRLVRQHQRSINLLFGRNCTWGHPGGGGGGAPASILSSHKNNPL